MHPSRLCTIAVILCTKCTSETRTTKSNKVKCSVVVSHFTLRSDDMPFQCKNVIKTTTQFRCSSNLFTIHSNSRWIYLYSRWKCFRNIQRSRFPRNHWRSRANVSLYLEFFACDVNETLFWRWNEFFFSQNGI